MTTTTAPVSGVSYSSNERHITYLAPPGAACQGYGKHRPQPMRLVLHHLLPRVCGGQTTPENTRVLCDNCHAAVHALLYQARLHGVVPSDLGTRKQRALALRGYQAAQAAGTVDRIPNEGGGLT